MAEPIRPDAALTFKRKNWFYVPAGGFADYTDPLTSELAAGSVLDFSRMAFRDGTTAPTQTTNRVRALDRLADDVNYERKGITQLTGGTLLYATDPQAVAASEAKEAWETFLGGPDGGFIVRRLNVGRAVAPTTGQFVTIYPADLGPSLELEVGEGEAAEVGGECEYFIRGPIAQMVALAAA
jgi:hypothetical protein